MRAVVRRDRAVPGIDLAEDKQAAALVDHDGRVLARKIVKAKACQLGELPGCAAGDGCRGGFLRPDDSVRVGRAPAGRR